MGVIPCVKRIILRQSIYFIIAFLFGFHATFAQQKPKTPSGPKPKMYSDPKLDKSNPAWKANRVEYILGAGASGYLGDLGGQDGPAKPFVYDYEPTMTRYSVTLGAKYFVKEYHAIRATYSNAEVRGTDALTNYPNRRYRNLNFKSFINEASLIYEFHLLKPNVLQLAGAASTRVFNGNRIGVYTMAGAGLFRFNPKGNFQGKWYPLYPLNTEGQGLPGGPDPYRRIAFTFPLGGGAYLLLNHNFKLGLEVLYRWTTTDYLDDASGYYYDNDAIKAANGKLAALFANPSVLLSDVPNPDWYTKNQPRGGSENNDTYLFAQLVLTKSFTKSISNRPIKQRKGPKMKVKTNTVKKRGVKKRKAKSYNNKRIKNSKRKFKPPKLNFGKKRKNKNTIKTF
ncbi:MAG: hypothetical protein Kow0075_12890 [Salibacteraceae bacterium]